jgi:hypothetical protein
MPALIFDKLMQLGPTLVGQAEPIPALTFDTIIRCLNSS